MKTALQTVGCGDHRSNRAGGGTTSRSQLQLSFASDSGEGGMKQTESIPGRGDSICRSTGSGPSVRLARGMRADGPSLVDLRLPCWQGRLDPSGPVFLLSLWTLLCGAPSCHRLPVIPFELSICLGAPFGPPCEHRLRSVGNPGICSGGRS